MTLLDFQLSGSSASGAAPSLTHLYGEMSWAAKNHQYLHMNALTRNILSWESSAAFPRGLPGPILHIPAGVLCYSSKPMIARKKK